MSVDFYDGWDEEQHGYVFEFDDDDYCVLTGYEGEDDEVEISDLFIEAGDDVFSGHDDIVSLYIASRLQLFYDTTFDGLVNLEEIIVSKDNESFNSKNNCNAIIQTNNDELLLGCLNTVIPDTVKIIGPHAFYKRKGLTSLIIPKSVEKIRYNAFEGCDNLKEINFKGSKEDWDAIKIEEGNEPLAKAIINFDL